MAAISRVMHLAALPAAASADEVPPVWIRAVHLRPQIRPGHDDSGVGGEPDRKVGEAAVAAAVCRATGFEHWHCACVSDPNGWLLYFSAFALEPSKLVETVSPVASRMANLQMAHGVDAMVPFAVIVDPGGKHEESSLSYPWDSHKVGTQGRLQGIGVEEYADLVGGGRYPFDVLSVPLADRARASVLESHPNMTMVRRKALTSKKCSAFG